MQKEFQALLREAEIGLKHVYAVNMLPDLRTFAQNLGEKMTLSLATNTTESKVCTWLNDH